VVSQDVGWSRFDGKEYLTRFLGKNGGHTGELTMPTFVMNQCAERKAFSPNMKSMVGDVQ
jgi:hypothetical protein